MIQTSSYEDQDFLFLSGIRHVILVTSPSPIFTFLGSDSRRFRRQFVAEIGDYSRQCGQASPVHTVTQNGDCRWIRRLSQFSATVAVFVPKSATIVASVDRLLGTLFNGIRYAAAQTCLSPTNCSGYWAPIQCLICLCSCDTVLRRLYKLAYVDISFSL